ncbi:MAG: DUF4186 domain-containing protein [Phycisphaerae bacterium]
MRDIDEVLIAIGKSKFRSGFKLRDKELAYLREKGLDTIIEHAEDFIEQRLAPAYPKNDGRQTPVKGHPVFIAQHAAGACCRKCLYKWHGIKTGEPLTGEQIDYIVRLIKQWIINQNTL